MKLAILLLLGYISANDLIEGHNDDLVMIEEQGDKATPWNPSKSREEFEKQRKAAADLVAEQVKFETTKSADVAKRNNDNIKATYEKNAATREKFMTATRGGITYVDKTPPFLALKGKICPGRPKSKGLVLSLTRALMVFALSCTEIPVVQPCPIKSTETVN